MLPRHARCPAERCALSSRVMIPRAVCQEYKVVAPLTKTTPKRKPPRHGPRIGDARRGTEARSPTSSATSMPLATPRSATGSRSWAARAKAPWASTALFNPHYQSWSRDGRATTTTLLHQDSALIENGCKRGSRGPRASADGIRMYTGPVSWVSKSNQCCEGCYSRVVCIHN